MPAVRASRQRQCLERAARGPFEPVLPEKRCADDRAAIWTASEGTSQPAFRVWRPRMWNQGLSLSKCGGSALIWTAVVVNLRPGPGAPRNRPGERSSSARETIRPQPARNIPRGWVAACRYVGQVVNLRPSGTRPGERSSPARETIRPPAGRTIPRGWVAALLLCGAGCQPAAPPGGHPQSARRAELACARDDPAPGSPEYPARLGCGSAALGRLSTCGPARRPPAIGPASEARLLAAFQRAFAAGSNSRLSTSRTR